MFVVCERVLVACSGFPAEVPAFAADIYKKIVTDKRIKLPVPVSTLLDNMRKPPVAAAPPPAPARQPGVSAPRVGPAVTVPVTLPAPAHQPGVSAPAAKRQKFGPGVNLD